MSVALEIASIREQALKLFEQTGLPSKRDEHWKYTDASRLEALINQEQEAFMIDAEGLGMTELDAYRLVLINGEYAADVSSLPKGISIVSLAELLASDGEADGGSGGETLIAGVANLFEVTGDEPLFNGLMALNAAKASDGAAICLADHSKLDKPLYILHIGDQSSVIRHGLMLGKCAEAEVVEHFVGVNGAETRGFNNVSCNVILKDGAQLQHYRVQQEGAKQAHFSRVAVKQYRDSSYVLHSVELGASLSRVDVVIDLSESGASCALNGLFVLDGRQHVDHHTRIDHSAPNCISRENYRTVLDGRSHGIFNGKVMVHKGASKTDSAMSNANILLSKHAEIDTKPELEIYNDDVKCAHGATVGQLDDKQLFYMRSRGLSEAEAKEVLTFAFADEILMAMDNNVVRQFVEKKAFAKLPHGANLNDLLG